MVMPTVTWAACPANQYEYNGGCRACPAGFFSHSDAGATSINECYGDLAPGRIVEVYEPNPDDFAYEEYPCWEGAYCMGGRVTVDWAYNWPDEYLAIIPDCPAGLTSPEGSTDISQCCNKTGTVCVGDSFRIDFVYSPDKVSSISPSIYGNNWWYSERFGSGYTVYVYGSYGGNIEMFPVPHYKSDAKIDFRGWYTEPNGGGTRVVGPDGTPMPANTYFTEPTTLYAYEKTDVDCQSGRYYDGTQNVPCPKNYYCPGTGTSPIGTPGCSVACPGGQVTDYEYSSSADACHVPCPIGHSWDSYQQTCAPNITHLYMSYNGQRLDSVPSSAMRVNIMATYGVGFSLSYDGNPYTTISKFPVVIPYEGERFMGWYTAENGGGTKLTDENGTPLISNTFFTEVSSISIYALTECADGYVLDESTNKCHLDCGEYATWNGSQCNGNQYHLTPVCGSTACQYTNFSNGVQEFGEIWGSWFYLNSYENAAQTSIRGYVVETFPKPTYTDGRVFDGWFTAENGGGTRITDADGKIVVSNKFFTADANVYAHAPCPAHQEWNGTQCEPVWYIIRMSYDKNIAKMPSWANFNGGEYAYEVYGESFGFYRVSHTVNKMPVLEYTDAAYQFRGWYTEQNCSGTRIADSTGAYLVEPTYFTEDVTLYACQERVYRIDIVYNHDNAYLTQNATGLSGLYFTEVYGDKFYIHYDTGSTYLHSMPVVRYYSGADRVFLGWYTEPDGGGRKFTGPDGALPDPTFFDTNVTLYAFEVGYCQGGFRQIKTSTGITVPLYAQKPTKPAICVAYNNNICYGALSAGNAANALNFGINGQTYHSISLE